MRAIRDAEQNRGRLADDSPVDFVPRRWRPFVVTQQGLDRHYYELCTLWGLRGALKSGGAWVANSRRYAPVGSYVMATPEWKRIRSRVVEELGLPLAPAKALDAKSQSLEALEAEVVGAVDGGALRVEGGHAVIPPLRAADRPAPLVELEAVIDALLPRVELCDLLGEVDRWTGFRKHLVHSGEQVPPRGRVRQHVLAAILTQACNIGFTRMARIADMTLEQLAWPSTWPLTDTTLRKGSGAVVNRQKLSAAWGGGALSSSDGQRFPVRGRVPISALPRYFGYGRGLTFYTWTSDQFSQYGTKVIPTTSRDATYVLDEILDNETELEVMEHTTDTAGYTDLIFGLFDLLRMRFAPRIRDTGWVPFINGPPYSRRAP